ncbi:Na/Pi cotransporter family protein [Azospirillum thermophilum]|uniref:Na+/Picotransporter n=1 Tax=Azospirillum thermophilum TaxID=2202148 RepID=A0A2S2CQR6_9PROT|nr:Na/Pi symporter [Azospirillum thermophilum]AWK86828.1 Na+/Picotransporter [Azospirillum thermophilum]
MDILATLFGGLGLFFTGVKLIGRNLQHMAGRRFRLVLAKATANQAAAAAFGTLLGVLTQSTNATTFIVINLITAGATTLTRAMPLVAWANLGTAVLVVLTVIDLRIAVLYVLGITGICFYFDLDRSTRYRHLVGALLGVGTLFLGLQLMKTGSGPLREVAAMKAALHFAASSDFLLLLIGTAVTMIAQSSATVAVLAVTMAAAGLFGERETILLVLGSSLGSGLTTLLMGGNLDGRAGQLAIFQALFKALGVAILLPLLLLEEASGLPLLRHLIDQAAGTLPERIAWVFVACQVVPALAMLPFYGAMERLLARLSPPTETEELSRPRYLSDEALLDPESALALAEKEQLRLLSHMPDYLECVRAEPEQPEPLPPATLQEGLGMVARAAESFQTELLDGGLPRETLERAIALQNRLEVLITLNDSLADFVRQIEAAPEGTRAHPLTGHLVESLHALLVTAVETADAPDGEAIALLQDLTADRGELMERIRRSLLRADDPPPYPVQQALFNQTTLFERIVWLIRRLALLLREAPEDADGMALAAD